MERDIEYINRDGDKVLGWGIKVGFTIRVADVRDFIDRHMFCYEQGAANSYELTEVDPGFKICVRGEEDSIFFDKVIQWGEYLVCDGFGISVVPSNWVLDNKNDTPTPLNFYVPGPQVGFTYSVTRAEEQKVPDKDAPEVPHAFILTHDNLDAFVEFIKPAFERKRRDLAFTEVWRNVEGERKLSRIEIVSPGNLAILVLVPGSTIIRYGVNIMPVPFSADPSPVAVYEG